MKIEVCIVDADPVVLPQLSQSLAGTGEFVCRVFGSPLAALEAIAASPPSLVILGDRMPEIPILECAQRLRVLTPELPLLLLATAGDAPTVLESLIAGFSGVLLKPVSPSDCVLAIQQVLAGGMVLSPCLQKHILQALHRAPQNGGTAGLSERERQIMALLFGGLVPKEIAARLGLSLNTIRSHIRGLFEKLQAHSLADAIHRFFALPAREQPDGPRRLKAGRRH